MELIEVTFETWCPDLYVDNLRHRPSTEAGVPRTDQLADHTARSVRTVIKTWCRDFADVPAERCGEAVEFDKCPVCVREQQRVVFPPLLYAKVPLDRLVASGA